MPTQVNNFTQIKNLPIVQSAAYNFAPQTPGGSLSVGANTVTLSPVPPGVNGTDVGHYLYISGGFGTAEQVLITGGTAVAGSASGTVIVVCAGSHALGWTIQSATSGIQEAIASLLFGGTVQLPIGTTISGTIQLPNFTPFKLCGTGSGVSTLQLRSHTNADLLTNVGFAALTNSGTSPAGAYQFTLEGLTLDGNKTNQSGTSWCYRIYGHANVVKDVVFLNGLSGNWYSEYAVNPAIDAGANMLENFASHVRSLDSGGDGILWRGPHDSYFQNIVVYGNAGLGFNQQVAGNYNGGSSFFQNIDTYLNGTGGMKVDGAIFGSAISATATIGIGLELTTAAQSCVIGGDFASSDNSAGLYVRGSNHRITGNASANGTIAAVVINVAQQSILDLTINSANSEAVQIVNDQGYMVLRGVCYIPSTKSVLTGTLLDSSSSCDLRTIAGSVVPVVIKAPNNSGWRRYNITKTSGNFIISGGSGFSTTVGATATTSQTLNLDLVASSGGGGYVSGLVMKTKVAATGVGTATANFGTSGNTSYYYAGNYNLKTAVSATNFAPSTGALANYGTPSFSTIVLALAITVDTTVSAITDGFSLDIWVETGVLV